MYIVEHISGGYLAKDDTQKWTRVTNIGGAERFTYQKASNILNNSFSDYERRKWNILHEEQANENLKNENFKILDNIVCSRTRFDNIDYDWISEAENQKKFYEDLNQYKTNLSIKMRKVEEEICDIEHYIEFFNLDAAKGYKAYRMLKERRIERRRIKDELMRIGMMLAGTPSTIAQGIIINQIRGLESRQYTPRVLKELFEV